MNFGHFTPDWPAPKGVRALATTRLGGHSRPPYDGFNLGAHVGDDPITVAANRDALVAATGGGVAWLNQVHGNACVSASEVLGSAAPVAADAAWAATPGLACAVMSADCLPVLFCDDRGTVVAAAHAGWRGLAAGVLENTVAAMGVDPGRLMAWLGPAIGPRAYEVGGEVRQVFCSQAGAAADAFTALGHDKWLCDLYALARFRLRRAGLARISGGDRCTHGEAAHFYSHRRDGVTGRMGSLVWLV